MKYQKMIDEEPWKEEDGVVDPISVYIISDENSEFDKDVVSALCSAIDNWGKPFTYVNPKRVNGSVDVEETTKLISSATWVIVVCSDVQALTGDNMFSYQENLALFEAMKKGLQNIVYLTSDVDSFPSKGFNHVVLANWSSILKKLIQVSPRSIDEKMFSEFYSQLTLLKTDWYVTLADCSSTLSRPSIDNNKIVWMLKFKESQGTSSYEFQVCGDSVKLESTGKVDVAVNCDLTNVESNEFTTWIDDMENTGNDCCSCGCCIFSNIFLYGYIAMSVFAASPVVAGFGYSEELRSTYIPGVQVAHMVVSLVLSLMEILCSTLEKAKEWRVITIYFSVFTTVCLILQALYFVNILPYLLDVIVGGGVLSFCVYTNNLTITNYFGAITKNSKCMIALRAIGFLFGVSLFIRFCIFTPKMFKLSMFSFKTTLVILSILFICEMGLFRVLVRYIQYFVRLKFKKDIRTTAELVLLLVFMSLWFGPSFFIY